MVLHQEPEGQVIPQASRLGKGVIHQTWQERGRRRESGQEGRGGEGRVWAVITFTCLEPNPPVQLSLALLLGLKGVRGGGKAGGQPPGYTRGRGLAIIRVTDETNRKEKLLEPIFMVLMNS